MYRLPPELFYRRDECVIFRKTREPFGAFSNMADGYPLLVNGHVIRYAEGLYQACRFPGAPELQAQILAQASPMAAKMIARKHAGLSRKDWETVKVSVMRWVVQLKCRQHQPRLQPLFREAGHRFIVEESWRDCFWGATPCPDGETLLGRNLLGHLLMEARDAGDCRAALSPSFPNARLLGERIIAPLHSEECTMAILAPAQLALSL